MARMPVVAYVRGHEADDGVCRREGPAIRKDATGRRGVSEAELIRDAIHLAAMANRTWSEPFFTRTYVSLSDSPRSDEALADARSEKAVAYERSKSPAP